MRLLLDTNALLWLLAGDVRLSEDARQDIENASEITVSEVSLWEISTKISIGKLKPIPALFDTVRDSGFRRLSISDKSLEIYESLPFIHRDPFDRMLVAQALSEDMYLLTSDSFLNNYGVKLIRATI